MRFRLIAHSLFLLCLTMGVASCGGNSQNSSGTTLPTGTNTAGGGGSGSAPGSGGSGGSGSTPGGSGSGGSGSTPGGGGGSGSTPGGGGGGSGSTPGGGSGGSGSAPGTGNGGAESLAAFAYVGSQPLTPNSTGQITGFVVASGGSAAPIPNSPLTGANSSLVSSSKYLVGTDGTNLVSYSISSNGTLSPASTINGVAHNDTPNGSTVGALSLDRSGSSVYAGEVNFQGTDNDAFAMFNIGSNGTLNFLANTAVNVNYHGFLSFTSDNHFSYGQGCYFLGWDVYAFARNKDGTLSPVATNSNSPPTNDNIFRCPFASSASSTGYLALLMSTEGAGVSTSSIALYKINADGSLTFVPGSIVDAAHASNIEFDPTGTYLAAVTSAGLTPAGVQIYQLSSAKLSPIGTVQNPETSFEIVKWDNSGHLYALSNESNALFIYSVNQGVLAPAPASPHMVSSPGSLAIVSTIQYQVSLFNAARNTIVGHISVDSLGTVSASVKSATASTTYSMQFCPAPSQMYGCFAVGNVVTDTEGNSATTIAFPKSGAWAGDFQLSLNGTAQYETDVVPNATSAVYLGTQQPATTVNGNGIFSAHLSWVPRSTVRRRRNAERRIAAGPTDWCLSQ